MAQANPPVGDSSNPPDDDKALSDYIAEQTREYDTYEATTRIYAGNALAYNVGHPVPALNVAQQGYFLNGQVKLKEGREHHPDVAAAIDMAAHEEEPDPGVLHRIDSGPESDAATVGDQKAPAKKATAKSEKGDS